MRMEIKPLESGSITVELSGGTVRSLSSYTMESPPQSSERPKVAQRAVRAGAGYEVDALWLIFPFSVTRVKKIECNNE